MTTFMELLGVTRCPASDLGPCHFNAWSPLRQFACIEPTTPGGERCGIGCLGCGDGVGGIDNAKSLDSRRWIRNHPTQPSRSAYGDFRDLEQTHVRAHDLGGGMTNVLLLPMGAKYQAAPCSRQTGGFGQPAGLECFNMELCDCYGDICVTPIREKCTRGEQVGELSIGRLMTCLVSTGTKWRPELSCALVEGGPIDRAMTPTHPFGDAMFNLDVVLLNADCAANMFINCTGKTQTSACCDEIFGQATSGRCCGPLEGLPDPCPPGRTYNFYEAAGSVTNFARIFVTYPPGGEPKLVIPANASAGLRAVMDAKNKALHRIARRMFAAGPQANQRVRFDQLDNQTATFPGRGGNDVLGLYQRKWRKPEGLTCAQMLTLNTSHPLVLDSPLVMEMPNCFLKHSRCPVTAKLYLIDINFRAHFIIIPIRTSRRTVLEHMFLPSVRVHVEGTFATSAVLADPECRMERPWLEPPDDSLTLAIDDSDSCEGILRYVRGRGADSADRGIVDEIVYVDDEGRRFTPPEKVHWWGNLGQTSRPNWHLTPPRVVGSDVGRDVCRMMREEFRRLNPDHPEGPLAVGGWPYSADTTPNDPNTVYGGMVKFRFQ